MSQTQADRFALFPESASSVSDSVDAVFLYLVLFSAFLAGLICVLIVYFSVRYRRGKDGTPSAGYRPDLTGNLRLEILWAGAPLILALVGFVWGADIFLGSSRPPAGATQITVVGRQWMWRLQHAEGRQEINTLHIPVGRPVQLLMASEDVIHSFYVPAFRLKQDAVPGRYSTLWFEPTRTGRFALFCAEYCGTEHSQMIGTVEVMEPARFAEWLAGPNGAVPDVPPAVEGQRIFERFACGSCHSPDSGPRGPDLAGLFGAMVTLDSGQAVAADEAYLREAILSPATHIVRGYEPIMPSYLGQISEEEALRLIAYLKSISAPAGQRGRR